MNDQTDEAQVATSSPELNLDLAFADVPAAARPALWRRLAPFALGFVTLAALVLVVLHFGEINNLVEITRKAQPEWLFLALMTQLATYACPAGVWHLSLKRSQHHLPVLSMVPLSIAKLFTDQAVPTGGISGAMLVVRGLLRRGIPGPDAMATMLVAMVSYYGAYLVAVFASLTILWYHHDINISLVAASAVFTFVAIGIPVVILGLQRWRSKRVEHWISRTPSLSSLVKAMRGAPTALLRDLPLMAETAALQMAVFLLDTLTFWTAFQALGQSVELWVVFVSFITASVAATLGPVPLGLGTFEAGSVAMMSVLGIPIETALAATLLFRGLTFWLPMLPGLWLARHEIATQKDGSPEVANT